ncbi:MAG TPA: bifunctional lysylphosphatidylglycerol flippase/synthetase MprF [Candidatus Eisenbacteria bacterium]|nr:bifunctional lysylphosphatidylglycerol flippase/synthetase MprF [Candidatus Eisenbacteria bacterium]
MPARTARYAAIEHAPTSGARRLAGQVVALVCFALALWALRESLRDYHYRDIAAALRGVPSSRVALALALAACGYAILVGYDLLAFRFVHHRVPFPRVVLGSFVSCALGNNLGNILVTGAAVRYWLYGSLGLSAVELTQVVLFCSLGFWLGFLCLGALLFIGDPILLPPALHLPGGTTRPLGIAFLVLLVAYAAIVMARQRPLRIGTWRFPLPSPALTVGQLFVATLDLTTMGTALWVLLPPAPDLSYPRFLATFLVALVSGAASQVPGGLGIFETVILLLLSPRVAPPDLVAALLAFRATYFILPLFVAAMTIGVREGWERVPRVRRLFDRFGHWIAAMVPQILAAAMFVTGAMLLFSGAVPSATGRLRWLHRFAPLPVIEMSHFLASLVGAALLILARGIQRRLDAAYVLALALLAAGCALSLVKGLDYEEAMVLAATFAALLPCRRYFYRKASLLGEPFTGGWIAAIVVVLAGSAWLGIFVHERVEYSSELWWRVALHAEAPRSLRATVGAIGLAVLFAGMRLFRPARPRLAPPNAADIERARPIVERSVWTHANLVFRGDKAILFSEAGDAFMMYGRQGRSWIAVGDPIGPEESARELVWQFHGLCERFGGWPVFFEVRPERLDTYLDLGLTLTKLGEEARVDLTRFALEAPRHRDLRHAAFKLVRSGYHFEILLRETVPSALPALARVSDAWLADKATREKGFSNASFDVSYLTHFPVAVVRSGDDIVAFANLWLGAEKEELSIDLMRHRPDAPNGSMDFLFAALLIWGRQQGYRWFNFGVAPLSGLERRPGAPLWHRVGTFVYRHGEHFYNFQGLRQYKEKFDPVWTPRYLASPGGLALPAILVDVAALMAGGLFGIVLK